MAAIVCQTAAAADSYVVVRPVDPNGPDIVTESGAIELNNPDLRSGERLLFVSDEQLELLRNLPNVALIYPASAELIAGVPVHACTPPTSDLIAEYILNVGKGWNEGGPYPIRLTYSIQSYTSKMSRERTNEAIEHALVEWSRYVQIEFTYGGGKSNRRHLNVLFASGAHGDPFPFDGPRKTLAHTFYPADVNPEPIAGDLHFDEDENWGGLDPEFQSVVLHEIGHALGLGHSDKPNAVMYPYYRRLETLLPEDIAAIRRLYPSRSTTDPARPETPAAPSPSPSPASTNPDNTAPTLRITTPSISIVSTSGATARIAGTASDTGGVAQVTWTSSVGRSGVANGTTNWSVPDLALRSGDNPIIIRAYDRAGNVSWRSVVITRR